MRSILVAFLAAVAAAPMWAGEQEARQHPEYAVVRQVIEDSIGWAMTKDLDRLLQIFANDDDLLIWWVSSTSGANGIADLEETAKTVWMTPDFRATRFEFRDVRIRFSGDGRVAWFSCVLDDCGIWKGTERCMLDVRETGVLEKRGDQWTIVQSHASWPVDAIPDTVWEILVQRRGATTPTR